MRNMFMTNSHPAPCKRCGCTVQAGDGRLYAEKGRTITFERDKSPSWVVYHRNRKKCKQPTTDTGRKEG
jgi:hypothetical protein